MTTVKMQQYELYLKTASLKIIVASNCKSSRPVKDSFSCEKAEKMSEVAENCALPEGELNFSEDQAKFLKFLFKKTKATMTAEVKKSQRESCTSLFNLLNQLVLNACADIIASSEKPKSCMQSIMSCGGKDGTEFLEVINEMQEKRLLEALMKQVEEEVCKITTDPHLEMKKYIEEVFEILNKFTEDKLEAEEATAEKSAEEDAPLAEEESPAE